MLGLVDPEEEVLVRAAASILECRPWVVRTRKEFEARAAGMNLLVVGNGQSRPDRISTVRRARSRNDACVIAGIAEDIPMRVELLEAGATLVVSRSDPPRRLARGIQAAWDQRVLLDPADAAAVIARLQHLARLCVDQGVDVGRCEQLTPREKEVVSLLARRKSNEVIAAELGIAVGTVKTHVHNILEKLDVDSRGLAGVYWRVFDEERGMRR